MAKKTFLVFIFLTLTSISHAAFITVDQDVVPFVEKVTQQMTFSHRSNDPVVLEVDDNLLPQVEHIIHENFNRCGGFIYHSSLEDAMESQLSAARGTILPFTPDYTINQHQDVRPLIAQVDELKIRGVINELTRFENRTYDTPQGVAAAKWLANYWKKLTANRSDITVELYNHNRWPQPSVIATIHGQSDETIVIGGHLDSVTWKIGGMIKGKVSPGADDNASGIATFTEVLRILVENNYVPQKTISFMGYAAEEVGLRGSKEIARDYRRKGVNVIGVMQLDMTNYKGSETVINIVNDHTNQDQNVFLGKLVDTYLDVSWGYTRCGYACSDHAAWTAQGFAASAPFESKFRQMNKKIHTKNDTLDVSGGNAFHATHFAKLALAYAVELSQ